MKIIAGISFIAAAVLFASCGGSSRSKPSDSNLTVKGQFANCSGDTLYFVNVSSQIFVTLDSVVADAEGRFELYGKTEHKGFYNIVVGRDAQQYATVILAPGDAVTLSGDAKNLGYTWNAEGSEETKHFKELNDYISGYEKRRAPIMRTRDSLLQVYQYEVSLSNNSKTRIDSLDKAIEKPFTDLQTKLDGLMDDGVLFVRAFVDKHPGSYANIPALQLLDQQKDIAYFDKTVAALKAKTPDAPNVLLLAEMVDKIHKSMEPRPSQFKIGEIPTDIELQNPEGKMMKLSQLRGKVVLIDFWASWCKPCRMESPNVVAAYKKYNPKGFEVFSVSLDRSTDDWKKAIADDGLLWKWHVLDTQDPNSSAATKYGASSIPRAFLLDREGKIIDTDVRGERLQQLLEEQFEAKN
ncbi:MAG: redoxin domain-containing protein [Bacteroidia bacterium]